MAVCPHCKDSVPGCTGGDACPLVSDIATNSRFFDAEARPGAGCPNLNRLLSPTMLRAFSRPVCEAIVGIASAPLGGREADVSDADAYPDARSIVQAAFYGHCSISSALLELTSRMTEAGEDELTRYRAAVDVLKARGDAIYSGAAGVYSFVFAKVSNVRGKIASSVKLQLESPSGSSKSAELSTTLRRPATVNDFFEMVHNYVWAVIVLGLASAPIVFKFIANTVHDPMRDLNISWSCAFEYLNLYLHEMDEDTLVGECYDRGVPVLGSRSRVCVCVPRVRSTIRLRAVPYSKRYGARNYVGQV